MKPDLKQYVPGFKSREDLWLWALLAFFVLLIELSAQPIPMAATVATNEGPEMRPLNLEWTAVRNAQTYDWAVSNAFTNLTGNTTLTNVSTWAVLGTNRVSVRARSNALASQWFATNRVAYQTSYLMVANGYQWRAKRQPASAWTSWQTSTNRIVIPTNAQQEFRVAVTATNFWGLR